MTSGSSGTVETAVAPKPRVVIVGGGFAGLFAARTLRRKVGSEVDVTLVNSTDYFLYLPLLPEVAGGVLEPRRVAVSLAARLPGVRVVLGEVRKVDLANRRLTVRNPEDEPVELEYDRLVIAAGGTGAGQADRSQRPAGAGGGQADPARHAGPG